MFYELFHNWIYIISTIIYLLIVISFICISYKNHPYLTIREAIQLILIFILCFIPIVNSGILVLIFVLALAAGITGTTYLVEI